MAEQHTYAVYFHPQALDVLGEAMKPYLSEGPSGQFVLCKEIDTGGSFCEITVTVQAEGKPHEVELMVPTGMVRLVVSVSDSPIDFGFG